MTRQEALLAVAYLASHDADWIAYEGVHEPQVTEKQHAELVAQANHLYDLSSRIYKDARGNQRAWHRAVAWVTGEKP